MPASYTSLPTHGLLCELLNTARAMCSLDAPELECARQLLARDDAELPFERCEAAITESSGKSELPSPENESC